MITFQSLDVRPLRALWRTEVDPAPARIDWYWSERAFHNAGGAQPLQPGYPREVHPAFVLTVNENSMSASWGALEW